MLTACDLVRSKEALNPVLRPIGNVRQTETFHERGLLVLSRVLGGLQFSAINEVV